MLLENEKYIVEIVDLGHKGEGIGKYEGFTVFVEGGLPGDKVKVVITKSKKNYAVGELLEIVEKSEHRVEPRCSIAKDCGGCQTMHLDYERQLQLKKATVEENLKRIGKLENIKVNDVIGMNDPYNYRNKAQYPIGENFKGEIVMGFYKKASHEIIPMKTCHIQQDINDKIVEIVMEYVKENNIPVYNERKHQGLLRHVVVKTGFTTGEIMVILVTNGRKLPGNIDLIHKLKKNIEGLRTVVQNINQNKGNAILGRENRILYGDGIIEDYIGDLKFEISPLAFFQVNPKQTKVLYDKALEYADLQGDENVFDIYCGIGTISLFLAQKAKMVYGIEIVEEAIEQAKKNAKLNSMDNTEFYAGKAEEVVPRLYMEGKKADVIVVDPPRKGCEEEVLDTMVKMNPKRIVYVSCNPSTLARDLRYMEDHGYMVVEVQPVDMFPHTTHVECVVLMSRADK